MALSQRQIRDRLRRKLRAYRERWLAKQAIALEENLKLFVHKLWPILEPSTPLKWNWHLDLLCEHLTAVKLGLVRRLIVNVPPRSMKSLLCTVFYPVWRWCTEPQRRFMFVSYSEQLSTDHSVFRRSVLMSGMYRRGWGNIVRFAFGQNLKTQYENTAHGVMFSTSIMGSATGKGCDELIVDDPLNAQSAYSEKERQTTNRNFDATFRSRLNDPATGAIIVIMQRLHDDDLTGHLLKREPKAWTHLKLPAEFEIDASWASPTGKEPFSVKAGQLLWPERFPREVLDGLKTALGSTAYAGQYQQDPVPLQGGIIQREWIRYYLELPAETTSSFWVQSWDCSFKDARDSDYVVGQVWRQMGAAYYLVDQVRARMDFVRTTQAIRQTSSRYPQATAKLIEDKANGSAVIASLRSEISGIIPVNPQDSKMGRLYAASPLFQAGNVYLPDPAKAPWVGDFVEELTRFPMGPHDDQVDACTQALWYFRRQMSGIQEYYRDGAEKGKS